MEVLNVRIEAELIKAIDNLLVELKKKKLILEDATRSSIVRDLIKTWIETATKELMEGN